MCNVTSGVLSCKGSRVTAASYSQLVKNQNYVAMGSQPYYNCLAFCVYKIGVFHNYDFVFVIRIRIHLFQVKTHIQSVHTLEHLSSLIKEPICYKKK